MTGGIPDLELDLLWRVVGDRNDARAKVNTDCDLVGRCKTAFAEADRERGFAAA